MSMDNRKLLEPMSGAPDMLIKEESVSRSLNLSVLVPVCDERGLLESSLPHPALEWSKSDSSGDKTAGRVLN